MSSFHTDGTTFTTGTILTTTTADTPFRSLIPLIHSYLTHEATSGNNMTSSILSSAQSGFALGENPLGALSMRPVAPHSDWHPTILFDDHDHAHGAQSGYLHQHKRPPHGGNTGGQTVNKEFADKVSFIFVIILIPCFSIFGSLGNILSLVVLVQQRMRNATNTLLAALAISDLLVLFHAAYFSFIRIYKLRNPEQGDRLRSLTFPLIGPYFSVFTARITTCLTMMISLERLVAVYFPMTAKTKCGRTTTIICIAIIYIVTPMFFLPTAFKYHCSQRQVNNRTIYIMELTDFGKNKKFFAIYGNILNVLFRLLPILILIVVNSLIAVAIKKTWSLRQSLSNSTLSSPALSLEQNRINMMLVMVSTVFLVCILPGAVHSIYAKIDRQYSRFGNNRNLHNVVATVTYFLETVNSSVNFFIYMAFSKKFSSTYRQIFCCRRNEAIPRSNIRSIFKFSMRGSRSSNSSYRELYFLNQLRKHGGRKNGVGFVGKKNETACTSKTKEYSPANETIVEEGERRKGNVVVAGKHRASGCSVVAI